MPVYTYSCLECGAQRELVQPISKRRPKRLRCTSCGEFCVRDVAADFNNRRQGRCSTWPLVADFSSEVNEEQAAAAVAADAKAGVPTQYVKTEGGAAPVWTGPGHRARWCRAHGLFDRNGGYGDPQRR